MTTTPNNSRNIVIKCSANFSSLRIEDPKRSPTHEESNSTQRVLLNNVPEVSKNFALEGKIGEGTFSKVYKARLLKDRSKEFALKYVIPTIKPSRIATELRYLRDLGGDSNVMGVKAGIFNNGHTVIVMEHFHHDKFQDYVADLNVDEIRDYIKNLLIALAKVHSKGVIHRDVKPSNFLYNRAAGRYALVDFGLAQNERDLVRFSRQQTVRQAAPLADQSHVKTNVTAILEKPEQRVVKLPEQLAAKKRLNDGPSSRNRKRARAADGSTKPTVFQTPETPGHKQAGSPDENVFAPKTPTKRRSPALTTVPETPPAHVGKGHQVMVPETPPKTTVKPKVEEQKIRNAKSKLRFEGGKCDTPKGRWQDPKLVTADIQCECFGKAQVCRICTRKPELFAPRAGTPGFRAPEVLLKSLEQTTAIDIWSAGVVFASLLSGRYPFFRNTDDMTALAEIITVCGTKRVLKAAKRMGKTLLTSMQEKPPMDMKAVCTRLRPKNHGLDIPDSAFDLLDKLLDPNPWSRPRATDLLNHDFFIIKMPKRELSPVMITDESTQEPSSYGLMPPPLHGPFDHGLERAKILQGESLVLSIQEKFRSVTTIGLPAQPPLTAAPMV